MRLKDYTQCGKCRKWVKVQRNKNGSFKDVISVCECGHKQICIDDNGHITRWREFKDK